MIGNLEPKFTWNKVEIPAANMHALTRIAVWDGFIFIAGANNSGTATVAPNIVRTC